MSTDAKPDTSRFMHPILGPFLAAVAVSGNVTIAARQVAEQLGMNPNSIRRLHYDWMRGRVNEEDAQAYREAFEEAKLEAAELLEAEARRRAVEGTVRPVFYQGEEVGGIREYSDTLLIFLLKGALPEKYAERTKTEHSGNVGLHGTPFSGMTLDEIAAEVGDADGDEG